MTIAVSMRSTLAGAKGFVEDRGLAPARRMRRERVVMLARRWADEQQRRAAREQALTEAVRRAVEREERRLAEAKARGERLQVVEPRSSGMAIIEMVAAWHGLEASDILGDRKLRNIAAARQDAMAAVATCAWFGAGRYGIIDMERLFNRNHATVLHALRKRGVR